MLRILPLFLTILLLGSSFAQTVQSPEQFLGYKVGTDYKIADYETIQKYFKQLAESSDKIIYKEIGKTSESRDMFMAVISSADNIKNMDKYRGIVERLSDPRKLTDDEARALAKEGKAVVLVTCNIHSTEIASSQMSMEFAYKLATGNAPEKSNKALDDVIFILMPSINPDGTTMVVDWYNKYLNTEYEGSSMPYLYQKYAGHDNNRDWFMFNLPETRNVVQVAYHEWYPQVWLDEHQMGSGGARLFVVPYKDPINPNVNPMIWRWQNVIGGITALDLQKQNYTGVIDHAYFEGWWEGPASDCGLWHNQIALLSEMASCNVASPVYIDPSEVKATDELTTYDIRTNYPSPWRGGWWKLRNIVDYELALTNSLLQTASLYKEDLLYDYYLMGKDAVEKGTAGKPYAYVIPRNQNDPETTSRMIEMLQTGGVEVHFADKKFTVENKIYPAESYVIYLAQPNGRYVKDLFEDQFYPDLRKSKKESPIRPYDVAGWTLPYLMGVEFSPINSPVKIDAELIDNPMYPKAEVAAASDKYYIASSGLNVNSSLINLLHEKEIPVYWNTVNLNIKGNEFKEGSVIVPVNDNSTEVLKDAAGKFHLKIYSAGDIDESKIKELKNVRIGLYNSYSASMDEGWTRLLLENYGFHFTRMENKDFKEKNLKDRFDVIIIPDLRADVIKTGKYGGEWARFNRPKPPEYQGGIEKEGVENLKHFVEDEGGRLITIGESCNFAIEDLGLRVRNVLKNVKSDDFFCPGSLIKMEVDNTQPIGYGMKNEIAGYLSDNMAFATSIPFGQYDRSIVVRYPTKNLLKSGYLNGEDYLYRRAAIVDVKQKAGHVILLGFKVQNRHQTFGTFKLLFNAIHSAGILN